jgi:hypothetical protein
LHYPNGSVPLLRSAPEVSSARPKRERAPAPLGRARLDLGEPRVELAHPPARVLGHAVRAEDSLQRCRGGWLRRGADGAARPQRRRRDRTADRRRCGEGRNGERDRLEYDQGTPAECYTHPSLSAWACSGHAGSPARRRQFAAAAWQRRTRAIFAVLHRCQCNRCHCAAMHPLRC